MLKVVGASWEQTRLTYILLAVVLIIGFFAVVFYEMPSKHEDGMYAATVSYSKRTGFKIDFWGQNNEPEEIHRGVARAYYKPDTHTTGWASIEIESNDQYPDWVQAYAAGLLEGSLSWQLIYYRWENTVQATCSQKGETCTEIRTYLKKVEDVAITHAQKSENDEPFWHHVRLFYYQLDGLEKGWQYGIDRSRKKINIMHEDFLWMNSVNEIRDLKLAFGNSSINRIDQYPSLSFLKYLPNSTHQFLLAHETGRSYSEMLRMHKKYTFSFHETAAEGSNPVAVSTITFTSYPGAIHSQDDYYQVYIDDGSRLTIAGSNVQTNKTQPLSVIVNSSNSEENGDNSDGEVPLGPRVLAASRLSRTAEEWALTLNQKSGTKLGGKQWLVVEFSSSALSLWLVEHVSKMARSVNLTANFKQKGFWISVGIPYFQDTLLTPLNNETYESSLLTAMEILEKYSNNATSAEKLYSLMHMPELIALGRADIIQYKTKAFEPRHSGSIDIKIADGSGDCLSVAGPPYSEEVEPFQWSRSMLGHLPHKGQPDLWEYGPVKPAWVWKVSDSHSS